MDLQPLVTGPGSTFLQSLQLPSAIANTQANTALQGQQAAEAAAQTTGLNLANQKTSMLLSNLPDMLGSLGGQPSVPGASPQSPSGSPGGVPIGQTGVDGDDVQGHAFNQYAPIPTARPPQVAQKVAAATILYGPEAGNAIGAQYDAAVNGANQKRQLDATQSYLTAQSVATAPAGAAWDTLNRFNPQAAAQVKQQHPSDDPAELDADVRSFASHIGAATHQYTGRPTDMQNGVLVDKVDGKPVVGTDQVLTGLDAAGKQKAFDDANTMVTVGAGLPQPKWQAAGAASAEAYVIAADRAARSSVTQGAAPTAPGGAPAQPPAQAAQTPAPRQASPASPQQVTTDPTLRTALADPKYDLKPPPTPTDQVSLAAAQEQAKATVAARTALLNQAKTDTQANSQADTYLSAAQQIMQSKGAPTVGFFGPAAAEVSRVFGGVNATNYQEVSKYLANAALQNGKAGFGAGMTEKENDQAQTVLNPSTHMTDDALTHLIGQMRSQAQYGLQTASRVNPFLATGKDPQQFDTWNQEHFPRQQIVAQSIGPGGAPVKVASAEQARALAKGTTFVTPDGRILVR